MKLQTNEPRDDRKDEEIIKHKSVINYLKLEESVNGFRIVFFPS